METVIKSSLSEKEMRKIFSRVQAEKKGVDVSKYFGKVKAKGSPVALQRKLRNEWK